LRYTVIVVDETGEIYPPSCTYPLLTDSSS
jgi:hypothetical protein